MSCNEFQKWLAVQNSNEELNNLPDDCGVHLQQCGICKGAIKKARDYFILMQNARAPHMEDAFWEDYLSTVSSRASAETRAGTLPAIPVWLRRLVLPAAVAVILISGVWLSDRYYPILDYVLSDDDAYTSSLDFIWSEHEQALSQHMFDPTPLYAVEEVIPENWEIDDPQSPVKK